MNISVEKTIQVRFLHKELKHYLYSQRYMLYATTPYDPPKPSRRKQKLHTLKIVMPLHTC